MRKVFLGFALIAAPLVSAFAQQAASDVQAISLDDAVRQAQANSPQTVQAKSASRVANANYKTAIAAFLPTVYLSQSAGHQQGVYYNNGVLTPTQGTWGYNQGYGLGLTLFNGGANYLDFRAARASLAAADENLIIQRFTIALNVKQQYFAVLAAREAEAAAEQQLAEANEQMAVTEARLAGGALSRADSLASAVIVGQAKLALVTAQGSLIAANTSLTKLVGGSQEVTAVAADTALVPTINVDSAGLVKLALSGPAVAQAVHQMDANHLTWWASLSTYLPSLSMSYSSGSSWGSPRFILGGGTQQSSTYLSFSLNYSLFTGFERESRVVSAAADRDNASALLRDARLTARENVVQYLAQFHTAEASIELQRLQIESATETVAAKDAQYRAGAVPLIDVLTQQTLLAQARQALIQARLDARTAKAQIEAIIGKNIE